MTQEVLIQSLLALSNNEVAKPVSLLKNIGQFSQFHSRKTHHSKRCMQTKLDGGFNIDQVPAFPSVLQIFKKGKKNPKHQTRAILISGLIFYKKSLGECYNHTRFPAKF